MRLRGRGGGVKVTKGCWEGKTQQGPEVWRLVLIFKASDLRMPRVESEILEPSEVEWSC